MSSVQLALGHSFPVEIGPSGERGVLSVHIAFLAELSDANVEAWKAYLDQSFFGLVRAGGLGGSQFAPVILHDLPASIDVEHADFGTLLVVRVWDVHVAPGAFRVLANVIESGMYQFGEQAIVLVELQYPVPGPLQPALDFPSAWPDCPFPVEEFPIEDGNFDVEIVFEQHVRADSLKLISEPIAAWLKTTMDGGFGGRPYDASKPGLQMNEKLFSTAGKSVILHVQQFHASPTALCSLQNVLMAIHHAGVHIETVVIAE